MILDSSSQRLPLASFLTMVYLVVFLLFPFGLNLLYAIMPNTPYAPIDASYDSATVFVD